MKKTAKFLMVFLLIISVFMLGLLTACNTGKIDSSSDSEHSHTFDEEVWEKDETFHWHKATCEHVDEVSQKAKHSWGAGVVTTQPSCNIDSVTTYTCTVCGQTKTETDTSSHVYGSVNYEWSSDNSTCTAKCVCTVCEIGEEGHEVTETVTASTNVTQNQDCVRAELTTYTADFTNELFEDQAKTNVETKPALGHNYGNANYEWSNDNSTCTAKCVCTVCEIGEEGHEVTETVTASKNVTQNQDCVHAELTTYTADFTNELFEDQAKTNVETKPALGHSYGNANYVWSTDNSTCTAKRVCTVCEVGVEGHEITETVTASTNVTQNQDCLHAELTTFTVDFTKEGFEDQEKTNVETKPALGHNVDPITGECSRCDYDKYIETAYADNISRNFRFKNFSSVTSSTYCDYYLQIFMATSDYPASASGSSITVSTEKLGLVTGSSFINKIKVTYIDGENKVATKTLVELNNLSETKLVQLNCNSGSKNIAVAVPSFLYSTTKKVIVKVTVEDNCYIPGYEYVMNGGEEQYYVLLAGEFVNNGDVDSTYGESQKFATGYNVIYNYDTDESTVLSWNYSCEVALKNTDIVLTAGGRVYSGVSSNSEVFTGGLAQSTGVFGSYPNSYEWPYSRFIMKGIDYSDYDTFTFSISSNVALKVYSIDGTLLFTVNNKDVHKFVVNKDGSYTINDVPSGKSFVNGCIALDLDISANKKYGNFFLSPNAIADSTPVTLTADNIFVTAISAIGTLYERKAAQTFTAGANDSHCGYCIQDIRNLKINGNDVYSSYYHIRFNSKYTDNVSTTLYVALNQGGFHELYCGGIKLSEVVAATEIKITVMKDGTIYVNDVMSDAKLSGEAIELDILVKRDKEGSTSPYTQLEISNKIVVVK